MASTYTFTVKPPAPEGTGSKTESHYANQPVDGSRIAIQAIGNGIQTSDATGTPVKSPVTVADSSVTTINVPESAIQITISTVTNTLNVSEVSSSMTTYFTIPTGQVVTFDVANTSVLYLESNTGNATVSFFFTII